MTGLRFNASRVHLEAFAREAAASVPPGAVVLDAGAGDCVYAPHFHRHRYESADFCQVEKGYGEITYVCDLTRIPVEEGRYDLVLCTQVLEHVPDPQGVLRELARVLRPGGRLWLSAPLFYHEHEVPHDYYRYTRFGLRHLMESAGFTVDRLDWLEGYLGTLAYQLDEASRALPRRPADLGGGLGGWTAAALAPLLRLGFRGLSSWFSRLDVRHRFRGAGQCKNYTVVAVKGPPGPDAAGATP